MKIKFMSFNIQHGLDYKDGKKINLSLMANTIKKCNADIVGLNEVRGAGKHPDFTDQAKTIADILNYRHYFAPAINFKDKGPYGNALVTKFPIINAKTIPIEDPKVKDEDAYYETRCILRAEFDKFIVYISHFGLAKAERKNAVKELLIHIQKERKPCVFMGDLNMTPDDEIIQPVYKYFNDTGIKFNAPTFSFPSDKPERRIDYIFATFDIDILSADIPKIVASDHRPHVATLDIN